MQLSIIIVNYNVKNYVDICLLSVKDAITDIEAEVFVVDNNSSDDSVEFIKQEHSWVTLIENNDNPGFSIANNQAINKAIGKYILLLNPDTIVEEETFKKCIDFMDNNPSTGALGVKMIGLDGKFHLESKRGLPTPMVSFYKMSGLSRFFPQSKIFNRYNLGYLPENEINEVEILCGAYMFMRKDALEKTGLLDERFFMYGEDIDLSYRMLQAGYKNYYFPETKILHFKGESTKKLTKRYIYVFNTAMILFAEKHFKTKLNIVIELIRFAIELKIRLSYLKLYFIKLQNLNLKKKKKSHSNELYINLQEIREEVLLNAEQKGLTNKYYFLDFPEINKKILKILDTKIKEFKINKVAVFYGSSKKNLLDLLYALNKYTLEVKLIHLTKEKQILFEMN